MYSSTRTFDNVNQTLFLAILLFSLNGFASDRQSTARFSLSAGAGPSYSTFALKLTFDKGLLGGSVFLGPFDFPYNCGADIHLNKYIACGSILVSPSLSIGHTKGIPPILSEHYDATWAGLRIDLTGYVTNSLFLQHNFGLEIELNDGFAPLPTSGVAIGYTFKGAVRKNDWYPQNTIFNAIGFGSGSLLVIALTMLYLTALSFD